MLTLFSPAKINWFLRVIGRRSDGYHQLSTVMQTVSLGDTLRIRFGKHDYLASSGLMVPCDANNLIWKAVQLFRAHTGRLDPVHIMLEKRIPIQSGLGGGSSNAATTLWGLNVLYDHLVSEETLQQWSRTLGADVPFFFSDGLAHCSGIGEIVQGCQELPPYAKGELHKPLYGLSTQKVFQALRISERERQDRWFVNDLEGAAQTLCPQLRVLKQKTQHFYSHVFMTGSGTGLIGVGGTHPQGIPIQTMGRAKQQWYLPHPENVV